MTKKDDKHKSIQVLIERLLRPVARLMLDLGLKHQDLLPLWKRALITVAQDRLGKDCDNISRLSVVTGLHRYDVKALLTEDQTVSSPDAPSLVARILSRWSSHRRYQTDAGEPRQLTCDGKESEFAQLVLEVSQALNPYTVLFELERLNLVARTAKGIKLVSPIHVIRSDKEAGLTLLGRDSQDLYQAVTENLSGTEAMPNLHIRTEYDNIPVAKLPEIRRRLLKAGTRLHAHIQRYLTKFDRDSSAEAETKPGDRARVMLTSFSFSEGEGKERAP